MSKNKVLSPFAIIMIAVIVAFTILDAIFNNEGPFTSIKVVAIVAAVCGVVNCVLSSNASIWNYFFGLPAVLCQGIVALHDGNIGVGWMDLAFLVPMQFIGFFMWMRHGASVSADADESMVQGRRLSWPQRILVLICTAICTAGLAMVLKHFGANSPILDGGAVVMQIVAQILMTFVFMEQWAVWIVVNTVYLGLWSHTYILSLSNPEINGGNALLMIAMWLCYLVIAIHGFRVWSNISK